MAFFAKSVRAAGAAALLMAAAGGQSGAQAPASCSLVKDAMGNLVLDPRCANTPAPAAQTPQPATPPGSAAQRFPYPGETPAPPSPASPAAPGSAPTPGSDVPAGSPNGDAGQSAAKRFPYPGEPASNTTAPPAAVPGQPPLQDAGSSGSSSSSGSSGSSGSSSSSGSSNSSSSSGSSAGAGGSSKDDGDDNPYTKSDEAAAPRRNRRKLPAVPRLSPSEQEQEDVQVAGFYQNDGNFKGAYDRAKDAVTLDAGDPAAFLALADSARKLGKLDEAGKAYRQCLELDPLPKQRRRAEQALKDMTGGG